ncbi:MAG TPA: Ldh family oxidoreductase [Candidatus Saccharimonadales bacterium]|nr:Ldh family oxidoreductase [Candidatus Saccharimonadales bacterium]
MKVKITELKDKVSKYLLASGLSDKDANTLTELIVEQELVGNQFSAVGELPGKHARLIENTGNATEEVVVAKPAAKLIKGNGRLAPIITADYLDEVIAHAKNQGIYALGIYDSTYNDFFDVFCRRAAAQDCVIVIVENGGPQGVTPFGGKTDVTGTNPIAYGIPTNKYPIVFDAATAMHAYGLIRQAKERGSKLPDNAYVDKEGNVTTDPEVAYAVLPFGGFKGYGINLLIDVLSGSLVRGKSGLDQPLDSQRYIGTLIIVIDPEAFGDIKAFKQSTTKLAEDILAVEPLNPSEPVRVPGYRGAKRKEAFELAGMVDIDDEGWEKFSKALSALDH